MVDGGTLAACAELVHERFAQDRAGRIAGTQEQDIIDFVGHAEAP